MMSQQSNPAQQDTIAGVVAVHAQNKPEATAFVADDRSMSWQQYHDYSNALAATLIIEGFSKGERIALLSSDCCETHLIYTACEKAGIVVMAITPRAGEQEIEHLVKVSGAVALLCLAVDQSVPDTVFFDRMKKNCAELRSFILLRSPLTVVADKSASGGLIIDGRSIALSVNGRQPETITERRIKAEELFLINTTSGTTGMPKCVMQNQRRWFNYAEYAHDTAELRPQDVFLRAVPSSVGFGLWTGHFIPTLLGAAVIVIPKFSVEAVLKAIELHKVTILSAVSTQFIMMLNHPDLQRYDLSSLRILYTGGEAVPYDQAVQFEKVTGACVLQFYGSNETGAVSYTTVRDSQEKRLRTAGRAIANMNVRLINHEGKDVTASGRGQPVCKGPVMAMGYFNNEEANQKLYTPDGSMKMEDIVTIDDEGYVKVVGRVGDFIIRGGKNISVVAVEQAVLAHDVVEMTAAVAMPDKVFGEKVCVFVSLKSGEDLSLKSLIVFLTNNGVSKEYFPEKLVILDELPTVSGGKVARHLLRKQLVEG